MLRLIFNHLAYSTCNKSHNWVLWQFLVLFDTCVVTLTLTLLDFALISCRQ